VIWRSSIHPAGITGDVQSGGGASASARFFYLRKMTASTVATSFLASQPWGDNRTEEKAAHTSSGKKSSAENL